MAYGATAAVDLTAEQAKTFATRLKSIGFAMPLKKGERMERVGRWT